MNTPASAVSAVQRYAEQLRASVASRTSTGSGSQVPSPPPRPTPTRPETSATSTGGLTAPRPAPTRPTIPASPAAGSAARPTASTAAADLLERYASRLRGSTSGAGGAGGAGSDPNRGAISSAAAHSSEAILNRNRENYDAWIERMRGAPRPQAGTPQVAETGGSQGSRDGLANSAIQREIDYDAMRRERDRYKSEYEQLKDVGRRQREAREDEYLNRVRRGSTISGSNASRGSLQGGSAVAIGRRQEGRGRVAATSQNTAPAGGGVGRRAAAGVRIFGR